MRNTLNGDLKTKRQAYRDFQNNAPLLWKTRMQNSHTLVLSDIATQYSGLTIRKVLLEKRLERVAKAIKAGGEELTILLTRRNYRFKNRAFFAGPRPGPPAHRVAENAG